MKKKILVCCAILLLLFNSIFYYCQNNKKICAMTYDANIYQEKLDKVYIYNATSFDNFNYNETYDKYIMHIIIPYDENIINYEATVIDYTYIVLPAVSDFNVDITEFYELDSGSIKIEPQNVGHYNNYISINFNVPKYTYNSQLYYILFTLDNLIFIDDTWGYGGQRILINSYWSIYQYTQQYNSIQVSNAYENGRQNGQSAGYTTGYTEGQSAGYEEGERAGYSSGQSAGYTTGYTVGYEEGEINGQEKGYTAGKTDGYNAGYTAGQNAQINLTWFENLFSSISAFFNIKLLPFVSIGEIISIPFVITVIWFIIRQLRGGGGG